jgi:hypothetical protein
MRARIQTCMQTRRAGTEFWSTPPSSCGNPCWYSRLQHIPFQLPHAGTGAGHPSRCRPPVFYWATVPSSLSFRLSSRNALHSTISSSSTHAQPTAAALPCWCGACLALCGKEIEREGVRRRRSEERESGRQAEAGNKWQFWCAQADGGVAGPLCRLTVLTPAARRHHKPHRSAASTRVLIRRRAHEHAAQSADYDEQPSVEGEGPRERSGRQAVVSQLHLHLAGNGERHGGLWIWPHGGVPSRWRRPQPRRPRVVRPAGAPLRRRVLPLRRARGSGPAAMAAARAAATAAPVLHLQHHPLLR